MEIHPITDADLPAVLNVYQQCEDFLALEPNSTASYAMIKVDREISAIQNSEYCGLFSPDGSLLGILDFVRAGYHGHLDCAFIELLMIAAPARGQGFGGQAVAWLENELRRGGIRRLKAAVQVNNPGALRFWQNQGFAVAGQSEAQPDGTVTYPLEKKISPAV